MIKIAICDDNENELEQTYSHLTKYQKSKIGWDLAIHKFRNGYSLLESIDSNGAYDIYILDIVMSDLDGIQLGAKINKKCGSANIILLSSSPEFGVESYTIFAKDYLLKPYEPEKLFSSLDRILVSLQTQKTEYYVMKTAEGVHSVPYHTILYMEYYKHRLICHMTNGEKIVSLNLRESCSVLTESLVKEGEFLRISSSHVVNMRYVKRFTSRVFEMVNGEILTLSRLYTNARGLYMDYVFGKKGQ